MYGNVQFIVTERTSTSTTEALRATPSWRRFEISIISTARRLRSAFDQVLEPLDLNLSQATLLAFVADFGSSTQTELAEMVGMGRAATGAMIDRLESRALLERHPDPSDRRVWLVDVTPAGRDLVDRFYEIDSKLRAELRRDINRADRQHLAELLDMLGTNIERVIDTADTQQSTNQQSTNKQRGSS